MSDAVVLRECLKHLVSDRVTRGDEIAQDVNPAGAVEDPVSLFGSVVLQQNAATPASWVAIWPSGPVEQQCTHPRCGGARQTPRADEEIDLSASVADPVAAVARARPANRVAALADTDQRPDCAAAAGSTDRRQPRVAASFEWRRCVRTLRILGGAGVCGTVTALLAAVSTGPQRPRSTDWLERDRAILITGLLAGLRADELLRANIGDLRRTDDGAVLQVRGKGDKDRRIPVEAVLVDVLEHYLDSRKIRFPNTTRRSSPTGGLAGWPADAPLFVGGDGQRITRGTLQYRVLRAFRQAGIDGTRAKGALLHGLRHTFATELANADVSVYVLMNLLGHESMTTSQRYISAAGTDTRDAAATSGLYDIVRSTE